MPMLLACPNGHQWEVADEQTVVGPQRCPVCAAEVEAPVAVRAVHEAETLRGSGGEPAAAAAVPGTALIQLPGYEMLRELGRGGMGVVYQARHVRLDRLVAIKMLPTEAGRDSHFVERFTREARALARLSHPAIITVHDFGQDGEQYYFVMEFVAGTDLRQRLRAGRLPPQEVFRIVGQICDALQYAHDEGIVHRDIKPENILIDQHNRVKIADFGIAKLLTHNTGQYTLTSPQQLIGTWRYMAPEQLEDPQRLDHRADIYSLGVVFYEMLTGKLPQGQFPPPSQVTGVEPRIDDIVLRALRPEPEQRFQKVSELKAALEGASTAAAVSATPARPATEPGVAPGQAATAVTPQPPRLPHGIRKRIAAVSWGLLGCGVLTWLIGTPADVGLTIALGASAHHEALPIFIGSLVSLFSFVSSFLLISAGLNAGGLRRYSSAVRGSWLAMLPLNPLWVVTFPIGFWSRAVLRDPKVKRAFAAWRLWRSAHPPRPGRVGRFLTNSNGWVIILCVVGVILCVQPLLPWSYLVLIGDYETRTLTAAYGYESPVGLIPAGILFVYMLVLFVIGFREQVALWDPVGRLAVGLAVFFFAAGTIFGEAANDKPTEKIGNGGFVVGIQGSLLGRTYNVPLQVQNGGVHLDMPWSAGQSNFVQVTSLTGQGGLQNHLSIRAGAPVYLLGVVSLTLLLLGTVQLRRVLQARGAGVR